MRKIAILLTMIFTFMLGTSVTFADPEDWFDRNYNFKNVSTVLLYSIDTTGANFSRIHSKNLTEKYFDKSGDAKVHIITSDELGPNNGNDSDSLGGININKPQLYVEALLKQERSFYNHYDAYTSYETRKRNETWKDSDGNWVTREVEYEEPVYHPAHDELCYTITMAYEVYDYNTGKVVWEREDTRSRETDDPEGMYKRSFDNFFNTLKKKVK